jgi:xenotropic and polytropic retrovirus receptor 1
MKFRRLLEYHTVPEWSSYYVDYRYLKRLLKSYRKYQYSKLTEITESLLEKKDTQELLISEIQAQSIKVNNFYKEKLNALRKELDSVMDYINGLKRISTLDEVEAKSLLSMRERDDAQNRATSMQRTFTELHQHIRWLEEFCEINYIGLLKIITKFGADRVRTDIESMQFRKWDEDLKDLKETIYKTIAEELFEEDIEAAKKLLLESKHFKSSDIGVVSFCAGFLVIMCSISGFILAKNDTSLLIQSACIFRFTFCICVSVVLFSVLIYMLEKYSVNWVYIFEITPSNKVSFFHILGIGISLATFWNAAYTLYLSTTYYYTYYLKDFIPVGVFCVYAFIIVCPFNIFFRTGRFEALRLVFHVIIAPFGDIRFKNYLVASWITSIVVPLKDLYRSFIFMYTVLFNTKINPTEEILLLISILPFVWRLLQNIKRVTYKKSLFWRQIRNLIRYLISIGLIITAYLDMYKSYLWIVSMILGVTVISLFDVIHDWQISLLNFQIAGKDRSFPIMFYYYAGISNFFLRFASIFTLLPYKTLENSFIETEIILTFIAVLEIYRRTQWGIIRIEREKSDNKENFRSVHFIPVSIK